MYYLILAFVAALLSVVPGVIGGKYGLSAILGIVYSVVLGIIFYFATPSLIGPLFGWYGFAFGFCALITAAICFWIDSEDGFDTGRATLGLMVPVLFIVVSLIVTISGTSLFRAADYAELITMKESQTWTQDVQPKDPKHMRLSSKENAISRSKNVLGKLGAIGSQFAVSENESTLQKINNQFYWIVPLDFKGFGSWYASGKVPAYIRVDAEDQFNDPSLIELTEDSKMVFTPGACFSANLTRHLHRNGYFNQGLTEYNLEIDDVGKAWWVVTVYHLEIVGNAQVVDGVVIVNPTNGETVFHKLGEVPGWVDRVVPDEIVKQNLTWKGTYSQGWWNAWFLSNSLTKAESPKLIYSIDGEPEWVTNLTSSGSSDTSMVAVVYTNSRTGQSVKYDVKGGGTDSAILAAVDKNQDVQFKKLHGTDPQVYNIYGHMAAVVPLLNENHAFQGVAIVDVANPQVVAVGHNQYEAVRNYQAQLSATGRNVAVDNTSTLHSLTGEVARINLYVTANQSIYYIHLKGVPHLFTGDIKLSSKLPVTQVGDTVKLEYYDSQEDVMPLYTFDNISLALSKTQNQTVVEEKEKSSADSSKTKADADAAREKVKKMTDQELQRLNNKLGNSNSNSKPR